ncbi:MAG: nitroreductase family protein [bacterium]
MFLFSSDTTGIHNLIQSRRSIRKFTQEQVPEQIVMQIIDDARFAPSPNNIQPWEFLIVRKKELINRVFSHLEWLGEKPTIYETPTTYIILLVPKKFSKNLSCIASLGACVQNILLSSWSYGIGTCWIGSIKNAGQLKEMLKIPASLDIFSIIALGYSAEKPIIEESKEQTTPYLDTLGKMHVPKKPLSEILHIDYYKSY